MTSAHSILWVSAHPEPHSLTHALRRAGITHLTRQGHHVVESDLYAMDWNPVVRPSDAAVPTDQRFHVTADVRAAYVDHRLPEDVLKEQEKILQADLIIIQFPLWWYSMPAILKGWFDRVFVSGFAFGSDPESGRRLRYEQGPFVGKRAVVLTTLGDRTASIGPRGKSGEITELLFGLLHGTFAYTGMSVLTPWAVPSADFITDDAPVQEALKEKLDVVWSEAPIPYRPQFTGEYTDQWELKADVAPGETGLSVHVY